MAGDHRLVSTSGVAGVTDEVEFRAIAQAVNFLAGPQPSEGRERSAELQLEKHGVGFILKVPGHVNLVLVTSTLGLSSALLPVLTPTAGAIALPSTLDAIQVEGDRHRTCDRKGLSVWKERAEAMDNGACRVHARI